MEITLAEAKLLNKLRQLKQNEQLNIIIGSKHGQRAFICTIQSREVLSEKDLTENSPRDIIPLVVMQESVVYKLHDEQNS